MPIDSPPQATFRALGQPRTPTVAQLRLLSWLTADLGSEFAAQVAGMAITKIGEDSVGMFDRTFPDNRSHRRPARPGPSAA